MNSDLIKIRKSLFYLILFIIFFQIIFGQIKDNFDFGTLETTSSIIDVGDYLNKSLILTTSGKIYIGTPLSLLNKTEVKLNKSSYAASCNENYMFVACLEDYLLVKLNINDGSYIPLLSYSDYNSIVVSNNSCCISIFENIVFIVINQVNFITNKTINNIIKLNITNKDDIYNGPTINTNVSRQFYKFNFEILRSNTSRDISCETIFVKNMKDYRLLCIYESKTGEKNEIWTITIKSNIEGIEENKKIYESKGEIGFRLYKIDNYYLRCVLRKKIFDLYINSNYEVQKIDVNKNLTSYETFPTLFSYNNNFIFSLRTTKIYYNDGGFKDVQYFKINTLSSNYYIIYAYADSSASHIKLYGYYNDKIDYLIFLYQSKNTIKYIIFRENKEMYNINSISIIKKYKSNEPIEIDISNILESSSEFGKLYIEDFKTIYSSNISETIIQKYPYDSLYFPIDKITQIITLNSSLNLWYELSFAFEERNDTFLRLFSMPNVKLNIRTCAFQCGSCIENYYSCDFCRDENFSIKNGDINDKNCYPIDQLLEGYIYNSTTKYFEKCFYTCKFCSKAGSLSSISEQNCLSCNDNYYFSYQYLGNCYLIENNENNNDIIINEINDTNFNGINSCLLSNNKNFKINLTKECVTECPAIIHYNSYECNFVNFTEQEYNVQLIKQCTETSLTAPKYYLGNYCYESCPLNSEVDSTINNKCVCKFAWHKDIETNEIICYEVEYCKYNEYKYYLNDTKECTNKCPSDYYQFNFQCYKDGCPSETSQNGKECESNYNYCYIDEQYKNQCSNEKTDNYIYNFNNTKQYLKSCIESLQYTISETKTYLYNGICYLYCPENTNNNNVKDICECLYFGYYSETDENDYICYSEEEKCRDKIPVNDLKICLDSIDKCIEKSYKIFNNECYSIECPENTEIKNNGDNSHCLCKNYYYNNKTNDILNCYDSTITSCIEKNYEYSNPLTYECFDSLNDCYNKENNFFFNKYCYKDTCSDYIALSSITDESIKNDFITSLEITNEYLDRICVCNIFNDNIKWELTINDGIYTQKCVTECKSEYEPNQISKKCFESCLSYKHYMFNDECYYDDCPDGTKLNEENGHICICENYFFKKENNELECYNSLEECQNNGLLYYNEDEKQCFSSLNNCFSNNFYKYFNKICYINGCPPGKISLSQITNNTIQNVFFNILEINSDLIDKICVCDIINDNNLKWTYDNINKEQECVNSCSEDIYEKIPESITHKCIEKCNPLNDYVFNDECYKYGCPEGTKLESNETKKCICENSYYIIEEINKMICCTNENKDDPKCNEENSKSTEINKSSEVILENSEENENNVDNENNEISESIDNIIRNEIIQSSVISESNKRSEKVESKENIELIDCNLLENDNNIICEEKIEYPPEYYKNPDKCLAVYNKNCYSKCPEGTCLTQKDNNLVYCVKIKSYMTIFNDICFIKFEKIVDNIKNISDNNLFIFPSPNIMIKAYTKDIKIDDINTNFTIIYLGECENLLKHYYNLPSNTILYILGVETPNKNKRSSINVYNYGVYIENGTQLDLSICEGEKITIYSTITNNSLIKLEEAKYFYTYGYDIYNESDNFYKDSCSPASINGNDITLKDRKIYYYPSNITICNDSCEFNVVNLTNEKIKCICDITNNFTKNENNKEQTNEEKEHSYTYLEYFLSLFNYKIIFCQKLLLTPSNYLNNIYFYLGSIITLSCIVQLIINLIYGIRSINKIIKENEPSRSKLAKKVKDKINEIREKFKIEKERKFKKPKTNICKNKGFNEPNKRNKNKIYTKKQEKGNKNNINNNRKKVNKSLKELRFKNINIVNLKIINIGKEKEKNSKILTVLNKHRKSNKTLILFSRKRSKMNETASSRKMLIKKNNNKKLSIKNINNLLTIKKEIKNDKRIEEYNYLDINLRNDNLIEKKDLNNIPFTQALRIDKRSIFEIFLYIIASKLEIINMFYYRNIYVHLSMSISLYIFAVLLDVTMNCFLYSDDVVSEKYSNNGSLEIFTSLSLSFASNIISSIIIYYLKRLGDYSELLDIMINDITLKKYYYINIIKFRKYLKIRLSIFYIIQIIMCILMTYYITIFCIIYNQSQVSIMINYIYGVLEDLGISFGITIIITIMRYLSLKYKWLKIYRTSQYLNNKF